MSEAWGAVSLTAVASTGDLTQLYPSWSPAGVDPATATAGDSIKRPLSGKLMGLQVKTDGANAVTVEIWDVNGHDSEIDVSSAVAITNAELATLVTKGLAKKIYDQNFVADGTTPPNLAPCGFLHGLAARVYNAGPSGTAELNLRVVGGFAITEQAGDK